jgi:hypothetical protein
VRDIEVGFVQNQGSEEQDVEIESAWPVGNACGAVAAELALDAKKGGEESGGRQFSLEGNHCVQKTRLVSKSHRFSGVERGAACEAADGTEAVGGGGKRGFRRTGGTGDVGAHPDISGLHHSRVARQGQGRDQGLGTRD